MPVSHTHNYNYSNNGYNLIILTCCDSILQITADKKIKTQNIREVEKESNTLYCLEIIRNIKITIRNSEKINDDTSTGGTLIVKSHNLAVLNMYRKI